MKWKSTKVSFHTLLLLSLIGLGCLGVAEWSKAPRKQVNYDDKLQAALKASTAFQAVARHYTEIPSEGVDLVNDPNATRLIGQEFTPITTDQGDLITKQTSLNPNYAAAVLDMLRSCGVKEGDYVAVALTGSFPALNICVLAALEQVGAQPVVLASAGASMWGANEPDFTWLDMETYFVQKGIFKTRSLASSLGGNEDRGGRLSPAGRELLRQAIQRNGVELIEEPTIEASIAKRMAIYDRSLPTGKKYRCYINVGGGIASMGSLQNNALFQPGVNKEIGLHNYPLMGTAILFGKRGLPVIMLNDVTVLAEKLRFPPAPVPIPQPGEGYLYYRPMYNLWMAVGLLVFYLALCFILIRIDVNHYLKLK